MNEEGRRTKNRPGGTSASTGLTNRGSGRMPGFGAEEEMCSGQFSCPEAVKKRTSTRPQLSVKKKKVPFRSERAAVSRIQAKAPCTSSTSAQKGHKKEEIVGNFHKKDTYQLGNAHPPGPGLAVGQAKGNVLHLLGTTV